MAGRRIHRVVLVLLHLHRGTRCRRSDHHDEHDEWRSCSCSQ
jgi:hypothetical protein